MDNFLKEEALKKSYSQNTKEVGKGNPKSRIDVDFKKYCRRQSEELSTESVDNVDKSVDRWISLSICSL
jgi:Ser-tRNA(Ala) deacylase AlaX